MASKNAGLQFCQNAVCYGLRELQEQDDVRAGSQLNDLCIVVEAATHFRFLEQIGAKSVRLEGQRRYEWQYDSTCCESFNFRPFTGSALNFSQSSSIFSWKFQLEADCTFASVIAILELIGRH